MIESDVAYFRRRAAEETFAAGRADHEMARQAHLDLATRYRELVAWIIADQHRLGLDLDNAA